MTDIVRSYETFLTTDGAGVISVDATSALDPRDQTSPFWYEVQEDSIIIGGKTPRMVLSEVAASFLAHVRQLEAVLVIESHEGEVTRCTPCIRADLANPA